MSARAWVERAIVPGSKNNTTELYAYLPDDEHRARSWLKQVLGSRVRLERVQRHGVTVWKLSPTHLLSLTGAIAYAYGPTKLRLEVLHMSKCDKKCQNAKVIPVWKCVCSCAGEFHKGRGARNDWYPVGRSTLISWDKTQIDQLIIASGQLPAEKKIPRPAPPPAPPAVVEPSRIRPPQPAPAQPIPAPTPPTAPAATVIPAADRFGDLGRRRSDHVPPNPTPARPAQAEPVPVRKPLTGPLVAAVLTLLALGGGIWLVVQPHPPAAQQQLTDQETIQPSPPPQELPPPPPGEEAPAPPQPRFPAGCFPFQRDC